MEKLIDSFANQIEEAIKIGQSAKITDITMQFNNIVICGLGGSGIGGTLAKKLLESKINIPIEVVKSYKLPAFASKNSLVIISSYSGNTEETLATMKEAISKNCKVVAISSGGEISKICKEQNIDLVSIPGGHPPRACLGYSLTQLFYVLNAFSIIDNSFENDLKNTINLLDIEKENIKKEAKSLADKLIGKIPVLYSSDSYEAVAMRFRQQINENSKMLCWHHVIPEMNHNELVGWRIKNDNRAVVILRNKTDLPRIQERMELNKQIISTCTKIIFEVWSKGNSELEKSLYLIHLGDWVSLYLSYLREVDTIEVNVIDFLKGELAKKN
ncbi:MAG: glucose/mannose-6-phosphate isomerase [Planctomycetota bacterium]|jgi:glucose/mannose-6-phosphate isomerase